LAVMFFNNLEEVVKIYQRMLVRLWWAYWNVLVGCDCINHQVCKVISRSNEDRFGYGKRETHRLYNWFWQQKLRL